MRAVCEPIVARFECDLCWTIRVVGRTVSTRRPSGQARDGSTRVSAGTTSARDQVKPPVRQEGESYLPKSSTGSRDSRVARAERQKRGGASARTRRQRAPGRLLSANCQMERGHPHCECGHSLPVLSFLLPTRTLALSL